MTFCSDSPALLTTVLVTLRVGSQTRCTDYTRQWTQTVQIHSAEPDLDVLKSFHDCPVSEWTGSSARHAVRAPSCPLRGGQNSQPELYSLMPLNAFSTAVTAVSATSIAFVSEGLVRLVCELIVS